MEGQEAFQTLKALFGDTYDDLTMKRHLVAVGGNIERFLCFQIHPIQPKLKKK